MNENRTCPYCNGTAEVLGNLGNIVHYRCLDCGIQFRVNPHKRTSDQSRNHKAKAQSKARKQSQKAKLEAIRNAEE